ncbi:MAG: DUF4347 domain-containing protein, partial [Lentisphaeraceae bacterium]|nr:DUF4347 domain-containing protein [Lentisphaeraceae bacterium]
LQRNVEVHILDADKNGISQISAILDGRTAIDAVHILSHGDKGQVNLGNVTLTSSNIDFYADQLQDWSTSFSENADILIYGCNTGQDNALISSISELTKTDVAASDDITGLGGDTQLEVEVGSIETAELFSQVDYESAAISLVETQITAATSADLQTAINGANAGDTLYYDSATDINVVHSGAVTISKSLTIENRGTGKISFDGQNSNRLFEITGSAVVDFDNLTFTKANNSAIVASGTSSVTINNSILTANTSPNGGGAIYLSDTATLIVNNTILTENSSSQGGALYLSNTATLIVNNSDITSNTATGKGGALYIFGASTVTITDTSLSNNSAGDTGGAIYSDSDATINLVNSTLEDLDSSNGSLLYLRGSTINLTNTTLVGSNDAALIDLDRTNFTINNSTLYAQSGQKSLVWKWKSPTGTITNSIIKGQIDSKIAATATYTWYSEGTLAGDGNIDGTQAGTEVGDLNIGPLADNGGPVKTMALGTDSIAIDAGEGTTGKDARGTDIVGTRDIGAYEYLGNNVSIIAKNNANEDGTTAGKFTVSLTKVSSTDTDITYTVAGTATEDTDYTTLTKTVTIAANTLSADIDVTGIIDDSSVEGNEDITITLISTDNDEIKVDSSLNMASIDIEDNDTASWSIATVDPTVEEAVNAVYTVSLSGELAATKTASVTLSLIDGETDINDYADFNTAVTAAVSAYSGPGTLTFSNSMLTFTSDGNGAMSDLSISLMMAADDTVEGAESFKVMLSGATDSTFCAGVV